MKGSRVEVEKIKENYKLHKKVTGAGDWCSWGEKRGVLWTYLKLSIVNCQISIVNEISTPGLLGIPNYNVRNYKRKTKGGHGLHKGSIKLQNITAFNEKFLRGGPGGAVFSKIAPLTAGGTKKNE